MDIESEEQEIKKLAAEIAELTGRTETEAVREALEERRARLGLQKGERRRPGDLRRFLETEIWPLIPEEARGKGPMTRAERARLLGYGPDDE
jgi:antitoxin VapB